MAITKQYRRTRVKQRIRKVVTGDAQKPRLSVFRSNKGIYAQLIDDQQGKTLVAASSIEKEIAGSQTTKTDQAKLVGKLLAEKATKLGISDICFDRNGYLYHGRVKALADSAREGGLKF